MLIWSSVVLLYVWRTMGDFEKKFLKFNLLRINFLNAWLWNVYLSWKCVVYGFTKEQYLRSGDVNFIVYFFLISSVFLLKKFSIWLSFYWPGHVSFSMRANEFVLRSWLLPIQVFYWRAISMDKFPIRRLTKENTQLGIISSIGYFKSPIGDILSNWGLVICSLTLCYQTNISPIPNWKYYL